MGNLRKSKGEDDKLSRKKVDPKSLGHKTFRLSAEVKVALEELAERTGLQYNDLLARATLVLQSDEAIQKLIEAKAALKKLEVESPSTPVHS